MYDDVMTRNDDNELAVRTVSSSGDNGANPNDVFTRDDNGRLALRTVGGSGGGGGGGAVDSVNGKTGVVVLNAKDVNAIPQYEVLPEAGVDNLGEIAQYVGNTGYQNGYIYKSSEVYSAPEATISQTVGSSLSDLAVDVNTFVEEEQPTQSGNTDFVASVAERGVVFTTVNGGFAIEMSSENFYQFMSDNGFDLDSNTDVRNGVIGFYGPIGGDGAYVGPNNSSVWFAIPDSTVLVTTYGAVITGEIVSGDYVAYTWNVGGETEWNKNGTAVDLGDYGISYNGTPENGDTLTVAYVAPEVTGYEWKTAEVMPATTITITMEG